MKADRKGLQITIGGFDSTGASWVDSFCVEINDSIPDNTLEDQGSQCSIETWIHTNYIFSGPPTYASEVIIIEMLEIDHSKVYVVGQINNDCAEEMLEIFRSKCNNFNFFGLPCF